MHLRQERAVAELLRIPCDDYTQGGLFPIAYPLSWWAVRVPISPPWD